MNLQHKKIDKIIDNIIFSEGCDSMGNHENNLIVFRKGIYIINVNKLEIIKNKILINCINFIYIDNVGNLKEWKINEIEWIEMSYKEFNNKENWKME